MKTPADDVRDSGNDLVGGRLEATKRQELTLAAIGRAIPRWIWRTVIQRFGIFILIGVWIFADAIYFFADAHLTRGEVIIVDTDPRNTDGVTYIATVRYRHTDGRILEGRTHISMNYYNYAIGEQVDIFYSNNRQNEVGVNDVASIYFPTLFFMLFGGLCIVLVVWLREKVRNLLKVGRGNTNVVLRSNGNVSSGPTGVVPGEPRGRSTVERMR